MEQYRRIKRGDRMESKRTKRIWTVEWIYGDDVVLLEMEKSLGKVETKNVHLNDLKKLYNFLDD